MAGKAARTTRTVRYWLKENEIDCFFPKLTKEKWEERKTLWQPGHAAGALLSICFGTYAVLNYLFPRHIDVSAPLLTFVGFNYVPRSLHRAVKVRDESDK